MAPSSVEVQVGEVEEEVQVEMQVVVEPTCADDHQVEGLWEGVAHGGAEDPGLVQVEGAGGDGLHAPWDVSWPISQDSSSLGPSASLESRLDVCQPRRRTSVSPLHGRQQPAKPDTSVTSAALHEPLAGAASHYTYG